MTTQIKKVLLVEGEDDKHTLIHLMKKYVAWGDKKEEWPVNVVALGGVHKLDQSVLSTYLKSNDIVGLVVDADGTFTYRWDSVRNLCKQCSLNIPDELPADGLIHKERGQNRLGVWIMPDNKSHGMLETFLQFLIPNSQEPIWLHAQNATATAVRKGAGCKDIHRDKSYIHTWLAWQDPPGCSLGNALLKSILDPRTTYAETFVKWFCDLFSLEQICPTGQ